MCYQANRFVVIDLNSNIAVENLVCIKICKIKVHYCLEWLTISIEVYAWMNWTFIHCFVTASNLLILSILIYTFFRYFHLLLFFVYKSHLLKINNQQTSTKNYYIFELKCLSIDCSWYGSSTIIRRNWFVDF